MDNITITKHKGDIGDIMISFFQNKSNIIMIMISHCSRQKAKNLYHDIILFILVKVILDSNPLTKIDNHDQIFPATYRKGNHFLKYYNRITN